MSFRKYGGITHASKLNIINSNLSSFNNSNIVDYIGKNGTTTKIMGDLDVFGISGNINCNKLHVNGVFGSLDFTNNNSASIGGDLAVGGGIASNNIVSNNIVSNNVKIIDGSLYLGTINIETTLISLQKQINELKK